MNHQRSSVRRARRMVAALAVMLVWPALAGCGDGGDDVGAGDGDDAGESAAETTTTTAEETEAFDAVSAQVGALDTVMIYCIPGLPGSPREGCDLGRILTGIGEVTSAMTQEIEAASDPEEFADVSTAIEAMDSAAAGIEPCGDRFASGGADPPPEVSCAAAWADLTDGWMALTTAMGWRDQ